MLEMFLEITTTRLLKMNFPAWQLILTTLPQKCWPEYLGNYTDNADVPILIWATTLMVKNEIVSINISMKLKNIFSNENIYFAVLYIYNIYI